MIELAAFLGNPGLHYKNNRHNAAWLFAGTLPFYAALSWKDKFKGVYASLDGRTMFPGGPQSAQGSQSGPEPGGPEAPEKVHFLFPQTFMNLSGESVARAASFFKIKTENILAVHDELELPLGTVSLKYGGGLGGHNGLRSMKAALSTADFWRLRIGIGRPPGRLPGDGGPPGSGGDVYSWVLSDFSREEEEVLAVTFNALDSFFMEMLAKGPQALLPEWKKKALASNGGEKHEAGRQI
ncbi:MAG: aminoacyl-tRNA hydrolase [Spirochaetaceae bacterium]|jgi:PTH1 family peptidyl-tRNA hydrolase|nr:aminoacyl-tRNA hydrolase [Spirochaetaceae bacterium]